MKLFNKFVERIILICVLVSVTVILTAQNYDIYRVNVKTGEVLQVTDLPGVDEYNPSFSNNGKLIVHDVVIPVAPFHVLAITDVNTGMSDALIGGEGGNDASWSPNGNMIVFDKIPYGDRNLYTLPAGGGMPTLIREDAKDAEWSPNSHALVFSDDIDFTLRTINLISGAETILGYGMNGSWSPNGKEIAYSNGMNLFKVKVDPSGSLIGAPIQLTFDGPDIYNQQPSWSNNSKTIVFHSNREAGDFNIWTISAKGGEPKLLTGVEGTEEFDPVFSKNGKWVAFAAVTPDPNPDPMAINETDLLEDIGEKTIVSNYPNPFRESTVIRFEVNQPSWIEIQIFNSNGALVKKLIAQQYDIGTYQVKWDGQDDRQVDLDSGMYTYYVISDQSTVSGKLIKVRN